MLQVRVVNSDTCELRAVEGIVARHVAVTRREWDRKLSYSLAVAEHSVNTRAEMVAEVLVSLYQLGTDQDTHIVSTLSIDMTSPCPGWVPLAPLTSQQGDLRHSGNHTAVCFKRREVTSTSTSRGSQASLQCRGSQLSLAQESGGASSLCLQWLQGGLLVCRGCPHTVLYTLVTSLAGGQLVGVSLAVSSIISDYTAAPPPVLPSPVLPRGLSPDTCQVLQLRPDTCTDTVSGHVSACLAREGYSAVLELELAPGNTLYFFVKVCSGA